MTITWLYCPHCGHRHGTRQASFAGSAACPKCYQTSSRPTWAAADAIDLETHYTTTPEGIKPNTAGRACGYC